MRFVHKDPFYCSLEIDSAMTMDGGTYTCVAENEAGKSMCSAKVIIAGQ